jgi:putative methyltransferase
VLLDPSCSGSGTASADVDASLAAAAAALAEKGGKGAGGGGGGEGKEEEKRRRRVAKLASFQLAALKHALRFPNAERVAYSTCSVHAEENERVVAAVLAWLGGGGGEDEGEKKGSSLPNAAPPPPSPPPRPEGWRLARALPAWSTRGIPEGDESPLSLSPEDAAKVIRAHPATDGTDGFFVAVFER